MVSSVSFGKIFTVGDRTVVGGGQSGIDSESLIKGLTEAKRLPAVKLEKKQEELSKQSTAFGELKTLLDSFRSSSNALRRPAEIFNSDGNVFDYRVANITASGTTQSGSAYVTATAENASTVQTFTISDVTSLARAKKQQTEVFSVASASTSVVAVGAGPNQFEAAPITFKGQSIILEAGDSLQTVSNKFNAVSDETGVRTSIVQVSAGNFRMVFTATETGTDADFDLTDPLQLSDPFNAFGNITISPVQSASNAIFKIDGIDVERQTNNIDDVVEGVTLNILQETPSGAEIDVSIAPDTEAVKTAITTFLDDYNNIRLFFAKQTEIGSDGTFKDTAVLGNNPALRSIMNSLSVELAGGIDGLGASALDSMTDIGVTFNDYAGDAENPATRNILVLDSTKLETALSTRFDELQKMFEFTSSSTNDELQVFRRTNALSVTEFTVSLNTGTNSYTASYVDSNGVTQNVTLDHEIISGGGVLLTGPAGSAIEGLEMVFSGSGTATATVNVTQGFADRVYNALEQALKEETGTISNQIEALKDRDTRITDEIAKIDDVVSRYREQLIQKFADLEKALASVNTILQSLAAQADARNNA